MQQMDGIDMIRTLHCQFMMQREKWNGIMCFMAHYADTACKMTEKCIYMIF